MPRPALVEAPSRLRRSHRARRAGAVLVALVLGLMCTSVMAGAATHHQDMPGMPGMSGAAAVVPDQADASSSSTSASSPASVSACDGMCASDAGTCTVAAAVGVPLLLVLLLAASRDTFLGLLPRSGTLRRRRRRDRWHPGGPSYAQLCVLRV